MFKTSTSVWLMLSESRLVGMSHISVAHQDTPADVEPVVTNLYVDDLQFRAVLLCFFCPYEYTIPLHCNVPF